MRSEDVLGELFGGKRSEGLVEVERFHPIGPGTGEQFAPTLGRRERCRSALGCDHVRGMREKKEGYGRDVLGGFGPCSRRVEEGAMSDMHSIVVSRCHGRSGFGVPPR